MFPQVRKIMSRAMKDEQGEYQAGAFHEMFARGRASGRLRLTREGVAFSNDQGSVLLPMSGLKVELGGASDRLVFFKSAAEPAWSVYTSDRDILKDPSLEISLADRQAISKTRSLAKLAWVAAVGLVLAAGLVTLLLWSQRALLSGWLASKIPAEQEAKLGELIAEQFAGSKRVLSEDEDLAGDWGAMLAPLLEGVDGNRYDYDIVLIEDSVPNAFALPGGKIFVHSGLLLQAERPEEVLGVVAHEIAHVNLQHGTRAVLETVTLVVVVQALIGDFSGVIALAAEGGVALLTKAHSRDAEREADEVGWGYMMKAGLDPAAMISLFEKLGELQEVHEGLEDAIAWISTHPTTDERVATLEGKRDALTEEYAPLVFDFESFLTRVRGVLLNPEDDESPTENREESDEHTH